MFFMLSTHVDSSGILSLVFRSLPPRQRRDADKLERVQKAATTMVSWLEDTKSKEGEKGRLVSLAEEKAAESWEQHNLIEVFHYLKVKVIDKS